MKQVSYIRIVVAAMLLVPAVAVQTAASAEPVSDDARWAKTLERVSTAIVTLLVDHTRSFEDTPNMSAEATGVVVDADRGLILTNRHVVGVGPVNATAVFLNQEEVELVPVWRDPVHDFGFFRYRPDDLKFIEPAAMVLAPAAARVGLDIRVVGNDAGERLAILSGTIARLDRQVPEYARKEYADFNTFYIQAASGTSRGSSGSPVIDIDGRIVALNAAGQDDAATSLFLPVGRVKRAFDLIAVGEAVPRGTLLTTFEHASFAELRRLGLSEQAEQLVRQARPGGVGLLTVAETIPDSPAAEHLQPGDIVVAIGKETAGSFPELANALDGSVGGTVDLSLERAGVRMSVVLPVADLNALPPQEYLEVGGALFHPLSYQQARHFPRPVSGVYVASPGGFLDSGGVPNFSLITALDGADIHDLDALEAALARTPRGSDVMVRYIDMDDPLMPRSAAAKRPGKWSLERRCRREAFDIAPGSVGETWRCLELTEPTSEVTPARPTVLRERDSGHDPIGESLVIVDFDMPFSVGGHYQGEYRGVGMVVDVERGWVVADRSTVPEAIGDVSITFAGLLRVPGEVRYIHPLHNLAVVSYDPAAIGDTPVAGARLSTGSLHPGQRLTFVGIDGDLRVRHQSVEVASIDALAFEPSSDLAFRDNNVEVASLVTEPQSVWGGVLVDDDATAVAGWWSWWFGFDELDPLGGVCAELIADMIERLRAGTPVRSLEVVWEYLPLVEARRRRLPEDWLRRYAEVEAGKRILAVKRVVAGSPAAQRILAGDLLLTIDGTPVTSFRDAERLSQRRRVRLEMLRNGRVADLDVETVALDGTGIERLISWAGALIEPPNRAISVELGVPPTGVYSSWRWPGSPAERYELPQHLRIVRVGGRPTPDLDAFAAAIKGLDHGDAVRVEALNRFDVPVVHTLRVDQRDWPAYDLRRVNGRWQFSGL